MARPKTYNLYLAEDELYCTSCKRVKKKTAFYASCQNHCKACRKAKRLDYYYEQKEKEN